MTIKKIRDIGRKPETEEDEIIIEIRDDLGNTKIVDEINLGSLKNPNKEVTNIKVIRRKKNKIQEFFR
jgi:hypothetical protein